MTLRFVLLAALLATGLSACADFPEQGFLTNMFSDDDTAPTPDQCGPGTACSPAPRFCVARGYAPGTEGYQRCIASVEETMRKQGR